jgi:imidazolonepropionase-like amidohydrolase
MRRNIGISSSLIKMTIVTLLAATMFGQAPLRVDWVALIGATIYTNPADAPVRNGVVLIQNGKLSAVGTRGQVKIPQGTKVVDCAGHTITAGFWNNHVHFMERKWADAASIPASELNQQLQDMLTRYGFTTAFDLSSPWENTRVLRDRVESGDVPGPRIFSTGLAILPANPTLPPDAIISFMGWTNPRAPEVSDSEQASIAARRLLDSGVDGIKMLVSVPPRASLSQGTIEGAVKEAHRLGKLVFVHPNTGTDVLTALQAGVDVIGHTTPQSGPWNDTLLMTAKEHRAALIPTLWIWKWYARHDRRSAQDKIVNTEVGQLRAWIANGGTVLFGTDLGATDPDPSEEYHLMAQAGMNFQQILASLTTAPAERFGRSKELGRVAVGFDADLVVLKDDPAKNIQALTAVEYTLRDGKIIYTAP